MSRRTGTCAILPRERPRAKRGKGKGKSKDKGKSKNKNPVTSAGYEPEAGAAEYQAQVYFATMFNMDEDEVHDSTARSSNWTGDDAAQAATTEAEDAAESVIPQEDRIGSDSDVDIDLPPWICSYHDGTARFSSWGHKCCYMCGGKDGDLRRCQRCHHHVHCNNTTVEDDMPCYDFLCGGMEFVCWGCGQLQRSWALKRARGCGARQPTGTVEPREGHQVRRSEERGEPTQTTRSGTQCDEGDKALPGPSELREPRGTAGLPRYRPTGEDELPRSREEIIGDQEAEAREARSIEEGWA
eukprot:5572654-Amphidinium_carterae.1